MKQALISTLRPYVMPLLLLALAFISIFSIRGCINANKQLSSSVENIALLNDTLVHYKEVNGKMHAQNRVASLRIEELMLIDSARLAEIKSLTGKLKRLKSDTRVRIEHDTVFVPVPIEQSTFRYEDSCIWAFGIIDSTEVSLAYTIKPQELSITQYQKGREIIASASIGDCGRITSMSSIIIDEPKKPWHETKLAKAAFGVLLIVAIIL